MHDFRPWQWAVMFDLGARAMSEQSVAGDVGGATLRP